VNCTPGVEEPDSGTVMVFAVFACGAGAVPVRGDDFHEALRAGRAVARPR
jgi:hypothetical protein